METDQKKQKIFLVLAAAVFWLMAMTIAVLLVDRGRTAAAPTPSPTAAPTNTPTPGESPSPASSSSPGRRALISRGKCSAGRIWQPSPPSGSCRLSP